jgi:hypothetical protein
LAAPDQPRLGIAHLIAATTLVALYMAISRVIRDAWADQAPREDLTILFWAGHAIGGGLSLGGLALLVTRRLQRSPFPYYPGEYLFVLMGLSVLVGLGQSIFFALSVLLEELGRFPWDSYLSYRVGQFFSSGFNTLICAWGAAKVKIRRWRWFFVLAALGAAFPVLVCCIMPWDAFGLHVASYSVASVYLLVVVLVETRRRKQYPWTHWAGVFLRLWHGVIALSWYVWFSLTNDPY